MRDYSVISSFANEDLSIIIVNTNQACFAGVKKIYDRIPIPVNNENKILSLDEFPYLLISNFRYDQTSRYIDLIIKIVNKITSCELITINGKEFIKFRLLETYDQSLVVLNFIRNLWNEQRISIGKWDYGKIVQYIRSEYNIDFFEQLKKTNYIYKDPFSKLTSANQRVLKKYNILTYVGHSNICPYNDLKIKTLNELFNEKHTSVKKYLT